MENTTPKHGDRGEYREFIGHWTPELSYTGDKCGRDIYCANCNTWNTVEGTHLLFTVMGNCKNCGTSFYKEPQ